METAEFKKGIDYIGVSVVFFCHDKKGSFVMARRSEYARDEQGRWDIGGGGLEFGSTPEETLQREILEEYCIDIISYEFLGYRDVHRVQKGKRSHWITLDFKVLVDLASVRVGEPHKFTELAIFTLDSLPNTEEMHSQLPIFFELYKGKL